jgi:hypothetical protein
MRSRLSFKLRQVDRNQTPDNGAAYNTKARRGVVASPTHGWQQEMRQDQAILVSVRKSSLVAQLRKVYQRSSLPALGAPTNFIDNYLLHELYSG